MPSASLRVVTVRWATAWLAALTLGACGVHKPPDPHLRAATPSAAAPDAEASLLGGPQRPGSGVGAVQQGDGFVLAGGPVARPGKPARATDSVGGFEMLAADDPAVTRQTAAETPDDAAAPAAEPSQAQPAGASARPADAVDPPRASPADPARRQASPQEPATLKALALWPMPSTQNADDANAGPTPQASGQSFAALGRFALFLLCVLGAWALWSWHRRRPRAEAQRDRRDLLPSWIGESRD